jgi:hypothetical protein
MTEQEIRKIVKEELLTLLTSYQELSDEKYYITDRAGTTYYGFRKKYSEEDIIRLLIEKLSPEVTND